MRRREFISLLGGASAALSFPAVAQQESVRRIGMLMPFREDDGEGRRRLDAVREGLQQLGWKEGQTLHIDLRWLGDEPAKTARTAAEELVKLKPEVIFAATTTAVRALMQATTTISIVFAAVVDPVGGGFVQSLAHPGGNVTGFSYLEPRIVEKWLELLKEIAPSTRRVSFVYDPDNLARGGVNFLNAFETAGRALELTTAGVSVHGVADIEKALAAAQQPDAGLIVMSDAFMFLHRDEIAALAARYRLPSVYFAREWVQAGGLISYGPDIIDTYRRAPAYIDRILHGARPSELPVQEPTKFELIANVKAAKALGLAIPQSILARADDMIE